MAAIAILADGATVTEAARRIGVDRTTLHRWLSGDALFVATLNRVKQETLDAVRREVRSAVGEAAQVVRELITDKKTPPAVRLRAALALLESAGALGPESIGPTSAGEVEARWIEGEKADAFLRMLVSS